MTPVAPVAPVNAAKIAGRAVQFAPRRGQCGRAFRAKRFECLAKKAGGLLKGECGEASDILCGNQLQTRLRMQGAALGFGLSVAISFLYYGIMRAGQALGHNGALPPYVAAWSADVLFGAVAIVMLSDAQRR